MADVVTKVTVEHPRSFALTLTGLNILGQFKGKWGRLHLGNGCELYFYESKPIAIFDGSYFWHHHDPSAALTRVINQIEPSDAPRINCSAAEFDYAVGSALTTAGLPLTRMPK